jgi:hypothetical protein
MYQHVTKDVRKWSWVNRPARWSHLCYRFLNYLVCRRVVIRPKDCCHPTLQPTHVLQVTCCSGGPTSFTLHRLNKHPLCTKTVKLYRYVVQEPRGRGNIASTHSRPWHKWPASRPSRALPPGKGPTYCTKSWVGPRAGMDTEAREKILCLCRDRTSVVWCL